MDLLILHQNLQETGRRYGKKLRQCSMVISSRKREEIANERADIKVGKINVDEQHELASEFGIMSIPTLVVMKNGKIVQQVSGARPKEAILTMI